MTVYGVRGATSGQPYSRASSRPAPKKQTPRPRTQTSAASAAARPAHARVQPQAQGRPMNGTAQAGYAASAAARNAPRGYYPPAGTAPNVRRNTAAVPYPARRAPARPNIGVGEVVDYLIGPKVKVKAGPKIKYNTVAAPREKRVAFPFTFIIGALMMVAMIAYLLMLYVQMNESESSINSLKREITAEQQLKSALEAQKNSREDIRFIEEQALALGMVKKETLQRKYVSVVSEDKVEVFSENQPQSAVGEVFSSINDRIDEVKEYLS